MPKVILTGAAGGIGQATARLLWEKGYTLVLTDSRKEALETAYPTLPGGSCLQEVDVTSIEAWQALAQAHGDADVLIQLAGVMRAGNFLEQPLEVWHLHAQVNLYGIVYGAWTFGRLFVQRGRGHLIHIASLAGGSAYPWYYQLYCDEVWGAGVQLSLGCRTASARRAGDRDLPGSRGYPAHL